MVIIKESATNTKVFQKTIVSEIVSRAKADSSFRAQKSSPQKVFIELANSALKGVAESLNPMADHYPPYGNRQLQNDVTEVYKDILNSIRLLEKIVEKDYGDNVY